MTIERSIYLVHVRCALPDLERVLDHGQALGFLAPDRGDRHLSDYPNGVEWAWYILPGRVVDKEGRIRVHDELPSRQVFYWDVLPKQYLAMVKATSRATRKTALVFAAIAQANASAYQERDYPKGWLTRGQSN